MKKYLPYLLIPLLAVTGALVSLNLFARVDFRLEALQASLSMQTSLKGYTVLRVPPAGEVRARTHNTPLSIRISLENIDLDSLPKMLAEGPEQAKLVAEAKTSLIKAVRKFVLLTLILGLAGGVGGLLLGQRHQLKELLLGGFIGLATVSVLLFGTYRTFNVERFQNAEYEGMIKAAPWMINLVQEGFTAMNTWGRQMRVIANNLSGLFQRVESLQAMAPGDGEVKVLLVSDIHNNPAAFEFIDQVVKSFKVNLVIDAGDLSDFGTPLEAASLARIKNLRIPYLITPGNHETRSIIQELEKIPNVTVLDGVIKPVAGLQIAGLADPSSLNNSFNSPTEAELEQFTGRLQAIVNKAGQKPDIVVAHHPKIAGAFWGQVPVVLAGHDHQAKILVKPNSVFINAGTSGASGIGAFGSRQEIPYSFVLLHFDRTKDGEKKLKLKYTDSIRISNLQGGYSLERRIYPGPNL